MKNLTRSDNSLILSENDVEILNYPVSAWKFAYDGEGNVSIIIEQQPHGRIFLLYPITEISVTDQSTSDTAEFITFINALLDPYEEGGGGGSTPGLEDVLAQSPDAGGDKIINLGNPESDQDAATKSYADLASGAQEISWEDVQTLIDGDEGEGLLVPGKLYNIFNPLDDPFVLGKVIIRASSKKQFEPCGIAQVICADFQKEGVYDSFNFEPAYALYNGDKNTGVWTPEKEADMVNGNVVIWNNRHWYVYNSEELNGTAPDINSDAFQGAPLSLSLGYGMVLKTVIVYYKYASNEIITVIDNNGNKISGGTPIANFPWNDNNIKQVSNGMFNSLLDVRNNSGYIRGISIKGSGSVDIQQNSGEVLVVCNAIDGQINFRNNSGQLNLHLNGVAIGAQGNNNSGDVTLYMDDASHAVLESNSGDIYGHIRNHSLGYFHTNSADHKDFLINNHSELQCHNCVVPTHNVHLAMKAILMLEQATLTPETDGIDGMIIENRTINFINQEIGNLQNKISRIGYSNFEGDVHVTFEVTRTDPSDPLTPGETITSNTEATGILLTDNGTDTIRFYPLTGNWQNELITSVTGATSGFVANINEASYTYRLDIPASQSHCGIINLLGGTAGFGNHQVSLAIISGTDPYTGVYEMRTELSLNIILIIGAYDIDTEGRILMDDMLAQQMQTFYGGGLIPLYGNKAGTMKIRARGDYNEVFSVSNFPLD